MRKNPTTFYLIRSYFSIVLGILLIALVLDSVLVWLIPGNDPTGEAARYRGDFALIHRFILDGGDPAASLERHRQALEDAMGIQVSLYDNADFTGRRAFQQSLAAGEIVSAYDDRSREILYQRIPGSDHILALGPIPTASGNVDLLETLVITSYYFLVACILFLWIRPFYRDLAALRTAASQFGRDDFSTRVEVSSSSSILPVAQSFNTMAERIQYLVSAHRELTSAVSHELRTPLARFKFSLEILSNTDDPVKKDQYLESMKNDVQELDALVDEILNYARLSENNLSLKLVDVNVKSWLQDLLGQYAGGDIQVQYSFNTMPLAENCHGAFNPELMARAVHNVLRNCLRYARSTIAVSASLDEQEVELRICDDGPGIPEDMREKIFEPFSRLDTSRDKQSGGHGLGLAIANRILTRHEGSITVENTAPSGACFILRWPR